MLSRIRFAVVVALMVFATPASGSASDPEPGVKAGEQAPKFTLKDQEGKDRGLDEFLERGKVALVFYRSANW
jgi:cytochrome oxidase Cu insertion factor (SCO1/SenC/PrrC family)